MVLQKNQKEFLQRMIEHRNSGVWLTIHERDITDRVVSDGFYDDGDRNVLQGVVKYYKENVHVYGTLLEPIVRSK